jgi:hypothetical protein
MQNYTNMGVLNYPNAGTSFIPPYCWVKWSVGAFAVELCTAAAQSKGVANKSAMKAPDPTELYASTLVAYGTDEDVPVVPNQGNYRINVLCFSTVAAGEEVECGPWGRTRPYAAGVKLGRCIYGAAAGKLAYIELYNLEED